MVTIQDLYDMLGKKIANEEQKRIIRNNVPPHIAEKMCDAIDRRESLEHFHRFLKEWNEWTENQKRL